jgi:hypothetical protein
MGMLELDFVKLGSQEDVVTVLYLVVVVAVNTGPNNESVKCHTPVWWPGLKNSPTVTHACRKRRLKWVSSV